MIRKILKYTGITIVVIILTLFAAIGITLNFIFTPEKITPAVNKIIGEFTDGKAEAGSVNLTFFSSFPMFSAEIDSLVIKNMNDSITDFVNVKRASVSFNPLSILNDKINIGNITLEKPEIYIFADSLQNSFDLFKSTASDTVSTDTTDSQKKYSLEVNGIKISDASLTVDDRTKEFYTKLSWFNFSARGGITDKVADLSVSIDWENLLIWQSDEILINKIALNAKSSVKLNRDSMLFELSETELNINGISLSASGSLRGDTIDRSLTVNVDAKLTTPSLNEFLSLIPTNIISAKERPKTSGSVELSANVLGVFSDSSIPLIDVKLNINNGKASYKGKKVTIDDVDCNAHLHIDLNKPQKSYLNIPSFALKSSGIISLNTSIKVNNILKNPTVDFDINNDINFSRLTELFPLEDGVIFKGSNKTILKGKVNINDIKNAAWNKIYLDGNSAFSNLLLSIDGSKLKENNSSGFLFIEMNDGKFLFGNSVTKETGNDLNAEINFSGLGFREKTGGYLLIKELTLSTGSKFKSLNKTDIEKMYAKLVLEGMLTGVTDKVDIRMTNSEISLDVSPPDTISGKGAISAVIKTDSAHMFAKADSSVIKILSAGVAATITPQKNTKTWAVKGILGFAGLDMYTRLFPININMPSTEVRFSNDRIDLKGANLSVGKSDMVATGYIENFIDILLGDKSKILTGNLSISSNNIKLDEIISAANAMSTGTDSTEQKQVAADTTSGNIPLIIVPKNINFDFNLNVNRISLGTLTVDKVKGLATVKDGALSLNAFDLEAVGAKIHSEVKYRNVSDLSAKTFMELNIKDIDISKIGELIPSVDSLMPMLKSFNGVVDCQLILSSPLNNNMSFELGKLRGAIAINGTSLALLDSETFRSISKMLMFKNKERNIIDSLGVDITIDNSVVEVLPFEVEIDRYRAIIGGSQTFTANTSGLNLDYKYNVSIMKSPLPFKAGVDIFGNMNDFDFKITKAKLKKTDFELQNKSFETFKNELINNK